VGFIASPDWRGVNTDPSGCGAGAWCREADLDIAVVEGIQKVDVAGGDELVFDEGRGWGRFFLKNFQGERHEFVSVTLRKIGYPADEAGAGTAQFGAGIGNGILAHVCA